MERISAASNVVIEVQPESWRLLVNGSGTERVLVEAQRGAPLRYGASFGNRRKLPLDGALPREIIQRVVLGWSENDNAWHLGLVLRGELVAERGSRWCGLAHWHDPLANQYRDVATEAGRTLATYIDCPFTIIPPHGEATTPTPSVFVEEAPERITSTRIAVSNLEPAPEAIPQPDLPLRFDLWTLQSSAQGLELVLAPSWGRSKLMRVGWNILWLAIFIILTVTTLTAGIALPRPEILVWLGVASIILLVLLILYNLYETLTYVNRIVFTPEGVRWMRGKRVRRSLSIDRIAEVYVSLVISKVGKRGKSAQERTVAYGEITLFLNDGDFESILSQHQTDETIPVTDDPINEELVVTLSETNARTRLQSAALMIARTLGVSAEYDKRLK
jgi:hypothetical protein